MTSLDFKKVTLGNILSIILMMASVFIAYSNLKADIKALQVDIGWIKFNLQTKMIANNK